jgi:hypothetical protein
MENNSRIRRPRNRGDPYKWGSKRKLCNNKYKNKIRNKWKQRTTEH